MERLPPELRARMEHAFAADFGDVRVDPSSSLAPGLGAHALAEGNTLHFAPGHYDPDGEAGRALIGHELTHVLQQRQGGVSAHPQAYAPGGTRDPLEHEADALGARAARGESVRIAPARAAAHRAAPSELLPVHVETTDPLVRDGRRLQPRFAVQIERDDGDERRIHAIHFSGRTDSPFARSMGAHTTAWVVHCDHVRAMLIGRTLHEAAAQLAVLRQELEAIAAWTWRGTRWGGGGADGERDAVKKRFWTSRNVLAARVAAFQAGEERDGDMLRVSLIQRAVAAYLEARNYLPLATIGGIKADGRAEGTHRARLLAATGDDAMAAAWDLFDMSACKHAATANRVNAADVPGGAGKSPAQRVAQMLAAHAIAIRAAYPHAFGDDLDAFLGIGIDRLDPSLKRSRAAILREARDRVAKVARPEACAGPDELRGDQQAAAELVIDPGSKQLSAVHAGRPDSPFVGTQGAHSTAWVVHEDALHAALGVGADAVTAKQAAQGVIAAATRLKSSPLYDWHAHLPLSTEDAAAGNPETGGERWGRASRELEQAIEVVQDRIKDDSVTLEDVQTLARRLLQVENLLPMATVKSGHTNAGRGEASLRELEGDAFRSQVWRNFDLSSVSDACESKERRKRGWDDLCPGVDPMSEYEERIALCLAQHLYYVKEANEDEYEKVTWYPKLLGFLQGRSNAPAIAKAVCTKVGHEFDPDAVAEMNRSEFRDDEDEAEHHGGALLLPVAPMASAGPSGGRPTRAPKPIVRFGDGHRREAEGQEIHHYAGDSQPYSDDTFLKVEELRRQRDGGERAEEEEEAESVGGKSKAPRSSPRAPAPIVAAPSQARGRRRKTEVDRKNTSRKRKAPHDDKKPADAAATDAGPRDPKLRRAVAAPAKVGGKGSDRKRKREPPERRPAGGGGKNAGVGN